MDEDRNTFLDEKEIKQWAADLGLQWSYTEVIKIHSIKKITTLTRREKLSRQRILTQMGSLVYWVSHSDSTEIFNPVSCLFVLRVEDFDGGN